MQFLWPEFLWLLLAVPLLVLLNGFFVAAEFALVKVRECFLRGGRTQTLVFFTKEIGEDFGYFDFVVNYQNAGRHSCRHGFLLR